MITKMRLLQLGKTQQDLLRELHARGYETIDSSTLSKSISNKLNSPQGFQVRELCDIILWEWENKRKEK